jgi:hypothetical protein
LPLLRSERATRHHHQRRGLPPALTLQPLQGLPAPGRAAAAKKMSALSILSSRYLSPSPKEVFNLVNSLWPQILKKEKALARSHRSLSDRLKVRALPTRILSDVLNRIASCNSHRSLLRISLSIGAPGDCNHALRQSSGAFAVIDLYERTPGGARVVVLPSR